MSERFAALVRRCRLAAGWSQADLAQRSTLAVRTIREIESGRVRRRRPESARLLADGLGLVGPRREQFLLVAAGLGGPDGAEDGPRPVGCQLPPDIADFIGRDDLLTSVESALTSSAVPPVAALSGRPGVGKTALAVRIAHRCRDRYPDGQLYVDLRGARADPVEPGEVLGRFLRALGMPGTDLPADPDERAATFRSRLTDRQVLVVLDDAAGLRQVLPLLPGTPGCAVLVTSRRRLDGLAGALMLDVDALPTGDALRLLGTLAGADRVAAQLEAARLIVDRCGRLPLTVRIAGARLAARPDAPVTELAEQLADERRRLDELAVGDLDVRSSLALSYDGLDPAQRLALRQLACLDVPDLPAWLVPVALNADPVISRRLVEGLVDARLLDSAQPGPAGRPRYHFHALTRAYARERAETEDTAAELRAAVARVAARCWTLAVLADSRLPNDASERLHRPSDVTAPDPGAVDELVADPIGWFDAERAVLVAVVRQAAARGLDRAAADLAAAVVGYFELLRWDEDWVRTLEVGAAAAARAGYPRAELLLLRFRTYLRITRGEMTAAIDELTRLLPAAEATGDPMSIGWTQYSLGAAMHGVGRPGEARSYLDAAAVAFASIDDQRAGAVVQCGLAGIWQELGDSARALTHLARAGQVMTAVGNRRGECHVLYWAAEIRCGQGEPARAEELAVEAIAVATEVRDRSAQGTALLTLAKALLDLPGRSADGMRAAEQAIALFDEIGDRRGRAVGLRTLGALHARAGAESSALAALSEAVVVFGELGNGIGAARTLLLTGDVHARAGAGSSARAAWEAGLTALAGADVPEATELRARLATASSTGTVVVTG